MASNLFQLTSSTLPETERWVMVTWGLEMTYFHASVGHFCFWKYQMSSLIWVIGHLARDASNVKMPRHKPEHMTLRISLQESRAEVHLLRIRMFRHGCTSDFQKCLDCLSLLLKFNLKRGKKEKQERQESNLLPRLRPRLPPDHKALFKAQNNQKLCLFFSHSLVSQLTSFFCTIYCIFCQAST